MADPALPSNRNVELSEHNMVERLTTMIQRKSSAHVVNKVLQEGKDQRRVKIIVQKVAMEVVNSMLEKASSVGGDTDVIQTEQQQPIEDLSEQHEQDMAGGDARIEHLPVKFTQDTSEGDALTDQQLVEDFPEELAQDIPGGDALTDQQPGEDLPEELAQDMSGGDAKPGLEPKSSRCSTFSNEELELRMKWRLQKLAEFENELNESANEDEGQRKRKPQTWAEFTKDMQKKTT